MKLQTITKKALKSCNFVNNPFLYNSTGFEDVANSWIEAIHNKYQSTSLWKAEGNPTSCLRKVHFRRDQFKIIHSKFTSSAFSIGILEEFWPYISWKVLGRFWRHLLFPKYERFHQISSRLLIENISYWNYLGFLLKNSSWKNRWL